MVIADCPRCGSARVHRSRRRNTLEGIISILGGKIRRCHDCNTRYASLGRSVMRLGDLRGASKKLFLTLAMAVALVFIMGAILWFGRHQTASANDTGCNSPAGRRAPAALIRA